MIVDCHTHVDLSSDDASQMSHLMAVEMVDACFVLACPVPIVRRSMSGWPGM